ncbi:MAG: HAD-IIA family hydrolase [Nocardioides sp.]
MVGQPRQALAEAYDLVMLDLDGVVYIGGDAIPGASAHLARVRERGARLAFITNNASRPPDDVASHLVELGIEATRDDVVTSAQAAGRVLLDRFGAGACVVVLGADGLRSALTDVGLAPVGVEDDAVALVTGYGPDVSWREVMRVAVRIRDGLPWVASNTDLTFPASYGVAPGHGVLVRTLSQFAGVDPTVAGKPARPLLDETVRRVGGARPLMVGDRLDTDIEGAQNAEVDSLLVMTGVTGLDELVAARPGERPTYVCADLGGLLRPGVEADKDGDAWQADGWSGRVTDGRLRVEGGGDPDAWWSVVAAAAWAHLDATGSPADASELDVPEALPPTDEDAG